MEFTVEKENSLSAVILTHAKQIDLDASRRIRYNGKDMFNIAANKRLQVTDVVNEWTMYTATIDGALKNSRLKA